MTVHVACNITADTSKSIKPVLYQLLQSSCCIKQQDQQDVRFAVTAASDNRKTPLDMERHILHVDVINTTT
jgi:hypothetical protein